ncbi:MAG: polysaccharide deacetylase family protein [Desulfobacterales bacterium]|nr:polysaccharide deacetylase family protein [Desulfobacterales bacterium]
MRKISILMYHQVGVFSNPKTHRATFCHVRRFKAQMAYLRHFGYDVISLQEALDALFEAGPEDGADQGHSVVLTFDDGYRNFMENAFPVLRKYDFPSTVFLVAGLLGKTAEWLARDGRFAPDMLDIEAVREMRAENVTLGSHTMTHPCLTRVDSAQRTRELRESKALLEDLLGEEIRHFCYPGGDFNAVVVEEARAAGYASGLTCIRGAATSGDDPLILPRKAISFGDSLIGYFWKLHMKHKKKVN